MFNTFIHYNFKQIILYSPMNVLESKEKKDKITSSNNYSPTSILDPKMN